MPKKRTTPTVSGAAWTAQNGLTQVALTLTPAERQALRALAGTLDLSMSELARRLVRWAVGGASEADLEEVKKFQKIG